MPKCTAALPSNALVRDRASGIRRSTGMDEGALGMVIRCLLSLAEEG
jgi:hypothetical protein